MFTKLKFLEATTLSYAVDLSGKKFGAEKNSRFLKYFMEEVIRAGFQKTVSDSRGKK